MSNIIEVSKISKTYKILNTNVEYLTFKNKIYSFAKSPIKMISNDYKTKKETFFALNNINFNVQKGEVIGIIGGNGAGKSTILKILSKIILPTNGRIKMKGKIVSLLEVGTGMHPELSGRENIFLNGAILGMNKFEIKRKFEEIVEFSQIKKFLDVPVKYYSSGMQVRLAFSVGAHLEHDILIIDEVLAVGDAEFQKKCIERINEISKNQGKTIILVSHNMEVIRNLTKRCILLNNGIIQKNGDKEHVIDYYLKNTINKKTISLSKRTDRKGSGGIVFLNVFFKDEMGNDLKYFCAGQDSYFWIKYRVVDSNIKEFDFSMPINWEVPELRLAHIYSKTINQKIKIINKNGLIKLKIKKLPFNQGTYLFNLWADYNGKILDWIINAGNFNVEFGDFYNTGKLPNNNQGKILLDYEIIL